MTRSTFTINTPRRALSAARCPRRVHYSPLFMPSHWMPDYSVCWLRLYSLLFRSSGTRRGFCACAGLLLYRCFLPSARPSHSAYLYPLPSDSYRSKMIWRDATPLRSCWYCLSFLPQYLHWQACIFTNLPGEVRIGMERVKVILHTLHP